MQCPKSQVPYSAMAELLEADGKNFVRLLNKVQTVLQRYTNIHAPRSTNS